MFCFVVLTLFLAPGPPPRSLSPAQPPGSPQPGGALLRQDVAELGEQLKELRDDTPAEVLEELAQAQTREALEALREGYAGLSSIYARRRIVRLLPEFDGVLDAEQAALQMLMDVATTTPEPELREEAVLAIARCEGLGKGFLRLIVDAPTIASVREMAMSEHAQLGSDEDHEWYTTLWQRTAKVAAEETEAALKEQRKEIKRGATPVLPPRANNAIRRMAFERVIETIDSKVLAESAVDDIDPEIRALSLRELGRRGERAAAKAAKDRFKRVDERPIVRIAAADVLETLNGDAVVEDFLDMGAKITTPDMMRTHMAQKAAIHAGENPKVATALLRRLGKGRFEEKRFVMLATRYLENEKIDEALREAFEDKDTNIRVLAMQLSAERGDGTVEPMIRVILADEESGRRLKETAFRSLSILLENSPAWQEELRGYLAAPERDLRNAALVQFGATDFEVLVEALAHPDWSTRLFAVERLRALRLKEAIGPLIERLPQETGRMEYEVAEALWDLTGQSFGTRTGSWSAWWAAEGKDFEPLDLEHIAALESEKELRRLKATTTTDPLRAIREQSPEFFGVRIVSERVIFILDISGSMAWEIGGEGAERGEPIRIDIARAELIKTLESLGPKSLFNLIVFSSGVSSWSEGGVFASTDKTREDALSYIERIGVGGGTNIYSALRAAFADPDADTIVFLSDGEPSGGSITDPQLLREAVAGWNEDRGLVIHTVAIGTQLDLLEWIAEDSGGTHVRYE